MAVNPQALRVALENSLADNPDDVVTCSAYADLLTEQGDPRGEFIQVQLALENESLPAAQRRKLVSREKQLLKRHQREWLGPLAPHLLDNDTGHIEQQYCAEDQRVAHSWRRGFLDRVETHYLTRRLAHALADAPGPCLLRELVVEDDAGFWNDVEPEPPPARGKSPRGSRSHLALFELLDTPVLRNLRALQVGDESGGELGWSDCHCVTPGLEHVLAQMPRIERLVLLTKGYSTKKLFGLANLTHLSHLQVEHMEDYPVSVLAKNAALANLTHLWFHPHFSYTYEDENDPPEVGCLPLKSFAALLRSTTLKSLTHLRFRMSSAGDDGVELLIRHGWLRRLKLLDLRHGRITDLGAGWLAESPDLKRLELLDLSRNQLTAEGVALLRAAGVKLRCGDQHPVGSTEYLTEGDFE